MPIIDKKMYDALKGWCDGNRPKYQFLMYVNSRDRMLTDATIRKLMQKISEEDVHGEEYIALYSAESFYRNMKNYYSRVAELYMKKANDSIPIEGIIYDLPATCGWITLIVEDVDTLSGDTEKIQEMVTSLFAFASKRANIIIIGNWNYKDVFSGCERTLDEMEGGLNAKEEDCVVMVGCYDQETDPDKEVVTYESPEKQCDELVYYWNTIYEQLGNSFFDYSFFKVLYKETLEFLIPRVTKERVFRKDLWLLDNIGNLRRQAGNDIKGCKPWEFMAARKMMLGLYKAVIDRNDRNNDFSKGEIKIDVVIENRKKDLGGAHIDGSIQFPVRVNIDNVCRKMDRLAETILECTYKGNSKRAMEFLFEEQALR